MCERDLDGLTQTPQQSHPLSPLHEPLHGELKAIRKKKCFLCSPFHGRACRWAMLGELKPKGPKGPKGRRTGVSLGYVGRNYNVKDLKGFTAGPVYGRAKCLPMLGAFKGPKGLILEILGCDPKGHKALLRAPSTEGRGVRLCWAHS